MNNIPEVSNNAPFINNAEFVKLTIFNEVGNLANTTVYTFSSAYKTETIGNVAYSPLGGLLAVGAQNRDLRVTSADTSISLSGIPQGNSNNITTVLSSKIKGSQVEIIRGFYGAPGTANAYILQNTYPRFTGIITSYNISEERQDRTDNFTVTVNASSYKSVLENRIAGRKTNKESWQVFNPTDTSMNRVYSLSGQNFDFGKKPTATTNNPSGSGLDSNVTRENIQTEQP